MNNGLYLLSKVRIFGSLEDGCYFKKKLSIIHLIGNHHD